MNSFENGKVRESGKLPIPSTALTTSWLSFFQSAETPENTTFVLNERAIRLSINTQNTLYNIFLAVFTRLVF
jgi:hypothetical protein